MRRTTKREVLSRFRCQALFDDPAILAAMCFVDLNPIRAGLSESLESSDFTPGQERIELRRPGSTSFKRGATENTSESTVQPAPLMSFQAESEIEKPSRAGRTFHGTPVTHSSHHVTSLPRVGRLERAANKER